MIAKILTKVLNSPGFNRNISIDFQKSFFGNRNFRRLWAVIISYELAFCLIMTSMTQAFSMDIRTMENSIN